MKKEKEVIIVLIVEKNYLIQTQIYESGSGWPSFYQSLPDVFETKTDHLLGYARTEYHCKKCGGHHGHIFEDGPKPTGKRYCNNGVCLTFKPKRLVFYYLSKFLKFIFFF